MKFYNRKIFFMKSSSATFLFFIATLDSSSCMMAKTSLQKAATYTESKKESQALSALLTNTPGPLVVKFSASWCPPCQRFGPIFQEVAKSLDKQVLFISIDIDAHQDIAARYNVKTIPTIIYLEGGKQLDKNSSVSRFSVNEFEKEVRKRFSL